MSRKPKLHAKSKGSGDLKQELNNISDALTSNNSHITIINNREIFVDGCKSIIEYCDEEIIVQVGSNKVAVKGCDLNIKSLSKTSVCILGSIKNIEFGCY